MDKELLNKRIKEYSEEIQTLKKSLDSDISETEKIKLKQMISFMEMGFKSFKKVNGV